MTENFKPVMLTPKAIKEIRHIMDNKKIPAEYGLRIGMKGGGGCGAGMSYMIGFDKKNENDIAYEEGGICVYVEKKHIMYLIGVTIDFVERVDERGFSFVKKNENIMKE